jgi:hypothetical protein
LYIEVQWRQLILYVGKIQDLGFIDVSKTLPLFLDLFEVLPRPCVDSNIELSEIFKGKCRLLHMKVMVCSLS